MKLDFNKGKKHKSLSPGDKRKILNTLKIDNQKLRGNRKTNFQHSIIEFIKSQDCNKPTPDLLLDFESFIVEAAKKSAEVESLSRSDWFADNEAELLLNIHLQNEAKKQLDHTG
jgi:hypothetical protein